MSVFWRRSGQLLSLAGGVAWATAFGLGGFALGKNIEQLLGPLGWLILASFAIGSYFLWSYYKSHEEQLLAKAVRAQAACEDRKPP